MPDEKSVEKSIKKDKESAICIIGGGVSGIYAGYLLRNLGYTNITLYEADSRLGGQAYSYEYEESHYELGCICFTESDVFTDIIDTVEKRTGKKVLRRNYCAARVIENGVEENCGKTKYSLTPPGLLLHTLKQGKLFSFLRSYYEHKKLLMRYKNYINEDFKNCPEEFDCSVLEFMEKNNADVIQGVSAILHASGYASPGTAPFFSWFKYISASNNASWYNPKCNTCYENSINFIEGVGNLFTKLVDAGIQCKLGTRVTDCVREEEKVVITDDKEDVASYDYCIVSVPHTTKNWLHYEESEEEILSNLKYHVYVVKLVKMQNLPNTWKNYGMWIREEFLESCKKTNISGTLSMLINQHGKDVLTVYQVAGEDEIYDDAMKERFAERLKEQFHEVGYFGDYEVVHEQWWRDYYPHVSLENAQKSHHRRLAGLNDRGGRLFFCGSATDFHSVRSCLRSSARLIHENF